MSEAFEAKVRIVKCSRPSSWYADKVGKEFVASISENNDTDVVVMNTDGLFGGIVAKEDIEIIPENTVEDMLAS